ncbi:MAG: uroporphyrinogen decarboxylase family protein [Candidatus Brocadiia bacterium]
MSEESLSNRERIFATIRGDEVDRYPVWLKMTNPTWQRGQEEPYRSMDAETLLRKTGCDLLLGNECRVQNCNPNIETHTERDDNISREVMQTPDGKLIRERTFDPDTESWHPTRFPVNNVQELAASRWLYRDTSYEVDSGDAEQHLRRQAELQEKDAVTMCGVGPGPLMNMVEHQSGPVTSIYLMEDAPELFGEVLELMHQDRLRYLRTVLPELEVDTFWLTENTSTTLISPEMFENYCMPHLRDYGNIILEHNITPVHHMCGTLNALLEKVDKLPALVNEAFTTPPVGDCTLAEGRQRMPSKALFGGTNATLLTQPLDSIIDEVSRDLQNCPDRRKIFLTSAGVLPAPISFDKARQIVAAFKDLPT